MATPPATKQTWRSDIEHKKANNCFKALEVATEILAQELLTEIIRVILSYVSHTDSTLNSGELVKAYCIGPVIDQNIPCLIISTPRKSNQHLRYCLSSIRLQLGWFPEYVGGTDGVSGAYWPQNGKYYCCIQRFDANLAPHSSNNAILYKSALLTTRGQFEWEYLDLQHIDLELHYNASYLFYVVELDHSLQTEEDYRTAYEMNAGYKAMQQECEQEQDTAWLSMLMPTYGNNWNKSVGLPVKDKASMDEQTPILFVTDVNYSIRSRKYQYDHHFVKPIQFAKCFEVEFRPLLI